MSLNILFISPGPLHEPKSSPYQFRFSLLSNKMRGHIFTTGYLSDEIIIEKFNLKIIKWSSNKALQSIKLIIYCILYGIRISKQDKIDCIVTYDPLKTGIIGCILKAFINAKLIVEVNGVYNSSAVWMDEDNRLSSKLKRMITPLIMKTVFRFADGIKTQFPGQIDGIINNKYKFKVKAYPNLTPIDQFTNLGEEKVILLVGFPFKLKGVDLLIKAFKKIYPRYPDWELKILGWYPDRTELDKEIAHHPRIIHHDPVPFSEIPYHIGKCGILALPSRSDALPRVLIEAAAAGKPRIGTNVDGIPFLITEGVDGYLIEPEDIDGLAKKLEVLICDEKLRKDLGRAGALMAKERFNSQTYLENTESFYLKISRGQKE
ncbi:MAG: glycosyltransferase [Trichloromonadaceae bacterium]